jgi:hypothetical protein
MDDLCGVPAKPRAAWGRNGGDIDGESRRSVFSWKVIADRGLYATVLYDE